jgi:RNA polymerase sigma-70 factor (ECF subfamily)
VAFENRDRTGQSALETAIEHAPALLPIQRGEPLVRRARGGDRTAQAELFYKLRPTVHATLYRVLGSNQRMEDLLQDAFVEIFRSLPTYSGEPGVAVWAAGIAVRVACRELRRESRQGNGERAQPERVLRLVYSEERMQHREAVKRLYLALDRLKPEYRVAFALFELDGRSLSEVAQITDVTLTVAQNRVSRARNKLRAAARRDGVLASYLAELEHR